MFNVLNANPAHVQIDEHCPKFVAYGVPVFSLNKETLMKIFEIINNNDLYYHGSYNPLEVGTILTPRENYEENLDNSINTELLAIPVV